MHMSLSKPFSEKLEHFKLRLHQQGKSKITITNACSAVNEFLTWFQDKGYNSTIKIDQMIIDQYFDHLEQRPNKRRGGGLSNDHLIKCFYGINLFYLFDRNLQKGQSGLKNRYRPNRSYRTVLTQHEVKLIHECCSNDAYGKTNKAILACFYGLGLRLRELYLANESDINFNNETFVVRHPKNGEEREVPMSPRVSQVLEEYLYEAKTLYTPVHDRDPALIVGVRGTRLGRMRLEQRMSELGQRSGLSKHVTPHVLRHSIGTHLIIRGLSVFDVMNFLGHKSLDSTQIYIHQAEIIKQEENERL